jgi:hypothetical protein
VPALTPVREVQPGRGQQTSTFRPLAHDHDPVVLRIRQRPKQNTTDDYHHGGRHAYTQAQRPDDRNRERRLPDQVADRDARIAQQWPEA